MSDHPRASAGHRRAVRSPPAGMRRAPIIPHVHQALVSAHAGLWQAGCVFGFVRVCANVCDGTENKIVGQSDIAVPRRPWGCGGGAGCSRTSRAVREAGPRGYRPRATSAATPAPQSKKSHHHHRTNRANRVGERRERDRETKSPSHHLCGRAREVP